MTFTPYIMIVCFSPENIACGNTLSILMVRGYSGNDTPWAIGSHSFPPLPALKYLCVKVMNSYGL